MAVDRRYHQDLRGVLSTVAAIWQTGGRLEALVEPRTQLQKPFRQKIRALHGAAGVFALRNEASRLL